MGIRNFSTFWLACCAFICIAQAYKIGQNFSADRESYRGLYPKFKPNISFTQKDAQCDSLKNGAVHVIVGNLFGTDSTSNDLASTKIKALLVDVLNYVGETTSIGMTIDVYGSIGDALSTSAVDDNEVYSISASTSQSDAIATVNSNQMVKGQRPESQQIITAALTKAITYTSGIVFLLIFMNADHPSVDDHINIGNLLTNANNATNLNVFVYQTYKDSQAVVEDNVITPAHIKASTCNDLNTCDTYMKSTEATIDMSTFLNKIKTESCNIPIAFSVTIPAIHNVTCAVRKESKIYLYVGTLSNSDNGKESVIQVAKNTIKNVMINLQDHNHDSSASTGIDVEYWGLNGQSSSSPITPTAQITLTADIQFNTNTHFNAIAPQDGKPELDKLSVAIINKASTNVSGQNIIFLFVQADESDTSSNISIQNAVSNLKSNNANSYIYVIQLHTGTEGTFNEVSSTSTYIQSLLECSQSLDSCSNYAQESWLSPTANNVMNAVVQDACSEDEINDTNDEDDENVEVIDDEEVVDGETENIPDPIPPTKPDDDSSEIDIDETVKPTPKPKPKPKPKPTSKPKNKTDKKSNKDSSSFYMMSKPLSVTSFVSVLSILIFFNLI